MSTVTVQIDEPFQAIITAEKLSAIAESTLTACAASNRTLSMVVTTAEAVHALNRQFRDVDASTDVLSFPATTGAAFIEPENTEYLGDIIIAAPVAQRQAAAMGHTPAEEMMLLTVHGVLHLLGYDHHMPDEQTDMWRKQAEILAAHNLSHVKPTEGA